MQAKPHSNEEQNVAQIPCANPLTAPSGISPLSRSPRHSCPALHSPSPGQPMWTVSWKCPLGLVLVPRPLLVATMGQD